MSVDAPAPATHVSVVNCPRCEGNHGALTFRRLDKPSRYVGLTLSHWALCPSTGEPVMLSPGVALGGVDVAAGADDAG